MYPDTYELGMANQALAILYDLLNSRRRRGRRERVFVPWTDMAAAMRAAGVPLFTLESCAPVRECDMLGITLPYELTTRTSCEVLDLAGIPLRAADRGDGDPLVVGGGPCALQPRAGRATSSTRSSIGEGEEAVARDGRRAPRAQGRGAARGDSCGDSPAIPGVYVPSLYEPGDLRRARARRATGRTRRRSYAKRVRRDLAAIRTPACPVVPFMDVVHDRANVEVLRGCTRGCRFCQAGMVYRPVRERPADDDRARRARELRCTGHEEISLTSLSTTDHSQLEEVLRRLTRRAARARGSPCRCPRCGSTRSASRWRVWLGGARRAGSTFAPEAGTQRLRDVDQQERDRGGAARHGPAAFGAGWRRLKLYFMIGLPTETDEDVAAIGVLVVRVLEVAREATPPAERGGLRVGVSRLDVRPQGAHAVPVGGAAAAR